MSHLMSLSGVKRTSSFAAHMSAFDPKRTYWTSVQLENASPVPEIVPPNHASAPKGGDDVTSDYRAASWCFRRLRYYYRLHSVRHEIIGFLTLFTKLNPRTGVYVDLSGKSDRACC